MPLRIPVWDVLVKGWILGGTIKMLYSADRKLLTESWGKVSKEFEAQKSLGSQILWICQCNRQTKMFCKTKHHSLFALLGVKFRPFPRRLPALGSKLFPTVSLYISAHPRISLTFLHSFSTLLWSWVLGKITVKFSLSFCGWKKFRYSCPHDSHFPSLCPCGSHFLPPLPGYFYFLKKSALEYHYTGIPL